MKHLLVTNDFPPKVGGIQTYLWELWRRLPPEDVTVVCAQHPEAAAWDRQQAFHVERYPASWLLPTPGLARRIHRLVDQVGAELVLLDPVLPLGALGPRLEVPYGLVVHGAELVVPAHAPFVQLAARTALRQARVVVAAGPYPAAAARSAAGRPVPTIDVPPGVDATRFHPLDPAERQAARRRFDLDVDAPLVVGVSRLVPRKGFDVVIQAVARLAEEHPGLTLAIAGDGRDRGRLEGLSSAMGAPVRFLGKVPDADLPALYGCADVFAMLCRDRWAGLEQEGFGIVFLEAAACGVPQVAGSSGGAGDAVVDGETGYVLDHPRSVDDAAEAIDRLLSDDDLRGRLGRAARQRAASAYDHDHLASVLAAGLASVDTSPVPADDPADEGDGTPATARGPAGGDGG